MQLQKLEERRDWVEVLWENRHGWKCKKNKTYGKILNLEFGNHVSSSVSKFPFNCNIPILFQTSLLFKIIC